MAEFPQFLEFYNANPRATFCDWLVSQSQEEWDRATLHPFTDAVGSGMMPVDTYKRFLIEDYSFIRDLATMLGYLVAKAPNMEAKGALAHYLYALTSTGRDYFFETFDALGVSRDEVQSAEAGPVNKALVATMVSAAEKGSYEDGIVCLVAANGIYLDWCLREANRQRPEQPYLARWIDMHVEDGLFTQFVSFLRNEVNRIGPTLPAQQQMELAARFKRICELEYDFFEAVWT
ncbi:transcriptional regulator [Rhodobacteraceae bacterium RKSG542]|uniref:TenA family protein n=1 Tax=Pseudovibrio flavus TaxID=2529854 RepID=UPI0012BC6DDC|nr:TenA family protein [Pseudovibrio flavus]MTI16811.1 transcriptional regulator [Pseudovibrio flavus]